MAEVFSGIYKIQSKVKPDRIYIGSAVNLNKRKAEHFRALRGNYHYSRKLQRHYNKYGGDDLVFSILLTCEKEELIAKEQFFIDSYKPYFNSSPTAGSCVGVKHTEESRRNMSIAHQNQIPNRKGCHLSEETKKKLHDLNVGKSPSNKGFPRKVETRIKISVVSIKKKMLKYKEMGIDTTVGIVTISHKRQGVLRLFCASIKRLRRDTELNIPCICVSDAEDKSICDKYNIFHISQSNVPVSFKWNTAMKYMIEAGVDYVIILGSDDIMSNELYLSIYQKCDEGISLIGINNCYFYGTTQPHKGKLYHFRATTMMGICKTIRMDIIKAVGGNVCPVAKGWGIDAIISKAIRPHITTSAIVDGFVCDVKSDTNLNKISLFASKVKEPTPAKVFYDILSDEEIKLLNEI